MHANYQLLSKTTRRQMFLQSMKFTGFLISCLLIIFVYTVYTSYQDLQNEWLLYKLQYGKNYEDREDHRRFQIFLENLRTIEEHNRKYEEGIVTFKMGINQFTDMTKEEFVSNLDTIQPRPQLFFENPMKSKPNASQVDWRNAGVITPVKNQESRGFAWSYAVVGVLESHIAIKTGVLTPLSEQNLIDCSGGSIELGFKYTMEHGFATQEEYPYRGQGFSCDYNRNPRTVKVVNYTVVDHGDKNMAASIEQIGPLAVLIEVTPSFYSYTSGIFHDSSCDGDTLNHAALLIGYGRDYWIIKNSWGPRWGEGGYIRIARRGAACGITSGGAYPILKIVE